ncbi:hypothetical protein ACP70R_018568 [Stipagrostis hirtigluma subsp. patula]
MRKCPGRIEIDWAEVFANERLSPSPDRAPQISSEGEAPGSEAARAGRAGAPRPPRMMTMWAIANGVVALLRRSRAILYVQEEDNTLLNMLREVKNSFQASLKSAEQLQEAKEASPEEIFEALKAIPKLARADLLRAYSMLTRNDRQFKSLMALPEGMRKDWLLMEIGKK